MAGVPAGQDGGAKKGSKHPPMDDAYMMYSYKGEQGPGAQHGGRRGTRQAIITASSCQAPACGPAGRRRRTGP
jgi:hypothetical protein